MVLCAGSWVQEMAGAEAGLDVRCARGVYAEEIGVEGAEVGVFVEDGGEVRINDFGDCGGKGRW